jgi:phage shock protein PspC (stress-responsive transcriptional regulator)
MKKVYQINFEGFEFYIDEDARLLFFEFIENNERHFMHDTDLKSEWDKFKTDLRKAIELKITSEKKVMSLQDLEAIMDKISPSYGFKATKRTDQSKNSLFRNLNLSVLGGVCSGLSDYSGIDVAWIRVLFIILAFTPVGIIGYIILWIAIPPSSVKNQKIKSSCQTSQSTNKKNQEKTDNIATTFFNGIGNLFRAIFKSIG